MQVTELSISEKSVYRKINEGSIMKSDLPLWFIEHIKQEESIYEYLGLMHYYVAMGL